MEWPDNTSWRQGAFLCTAAIDALGLCAAEERDTTLVIVASHDCDLNHPETSEPSVEIIIGKKIQSADGNFTHAKNSRQLHLELDFSTPLWGAFSALEKKSVPKNALAPYQPREDVRLSIDNKKTFKMWLGSRYHRSEFPNEFEDRLRATKLHNKINSAIQKYATEIVGIFFDVDGGEEIERDGEDDAHVLNIVLLHSTNPTFDAARKAAEEAAREIRQGFEVKLFKPTQMWKQIELASCDVISEGALTYEYYKSLKKWRYEHISRANQPEQTIAMD